MVILTGNAGCQIAMEGGTDIYGNGGLYSHKRRRTDDYGDQNV